MKTLNVPDTIQSNDYTCGVAVTQAISSYYGIDWYDNDLEKELQPLTAEDGVPRANIIKFFKRNGFNVWHGKLQIKNIIKCIDNNIPVIILIQAWAEIANVNWEKTLQYGHYVICSGYTHNKMIIEDPAMLGRTYLTYQELEQRWHGFDDKILKNFGIAVWGKRPYNFNKLYHMESKENKISLLEMFITEK